MSLLRILIFLLPVAAAFGGPLEVIPHSTSSSGQFIVYSNDPKARSLAAIHAEDQKREFLELLRTTDNWKLPVIVNLDATPPLVRRPPQWQLRIYEGDDRKNKVQLDIFDRSLLDSPDFQTLLLSTLVLEYSYRNTPVKAGRPFQEPPTWFVQGLAQRIRSQDQGLPASLYASLLSTGAPPRLNDFLDSRLDRMDPTLLAIYQAQAAAFIDAILSLPDGRDGLRSYLSVPRKSPPSLDEIVGCIPSLGKKSEELSRKWVLSMARSSAADRVDLMTARDTGDELDRILTVKALPDPKHPEMAAMSGPYALPAIARSRNGRFILSQTQEDLLKLSLRAHPLYKSLVDEYLRIVRELVQKPKRHEEKAIATAEDVRAGLQRQSDEIRDYMDWVQATKIHTDNDDLQKVVQSVNDLANPPPRTDEISRYLDAVAARSE